MSFGLDFIGPRGGELAIAFATGCGAGYAFCVRTIHKMLQTHSDAAHEECVRRITKLEEEKRELSDRVQLIEERWMMGANRQLAQVHDSSVRVLGAEKLGGPVE